MVAVNGRVQEQMVAAAEADLDSIVRRQKKWEDKVGEARTPQERNQARFMVRRARLEQARAQMRLLAYLRGMSFPPVVDLAAEDAERADEHAGLFR